MKTPLTEDILRHVRSLPPLPLAAQRLLSATSDPAIDIRTLTRIVEKDQVLTTRILRVANSSFYGLPRQVETISKAVVILGIQAVRNIALRAAMLGLQRGGDGVLKSHLEAFWKHAIAVASAAQLLAIPLRLPQPEVAFVAGLLHDLGKVILIEVLGERYVRLLDGVKHGTAPLHVREHVAFGITHTQAGYALCEHWKIPMQLTRVVAAHHTPVDPHGAMSPEDLLIHTVRVANSLAKMTQIGSSGNPYVEPGSFSIVRARARQGALQQVLQALPAKVRTIEAMFVDTPEPETSTVPRTDPVLVGACLSTPETNDVVTLALQERGCSVVPLEGALPLAMIGVIADASLPLVLQEQLTQQGIPVLNLSPKGNDDRPPFPSVNVNRLHSWISNAIKTAPQ